MVINFWSSKVSFFAKLGAEIKDFFFLIKNARIISVIELKRGVPIFDIILSKLNN